jgi:spermidine synthase
MKLDRPYCLLPFSLGLTAMATQIILLREFLSLLYGNELVIGLVLSTWMLLTGFGAWLGRKGFEGQGGLPLILLLLLLLSTLATLTLFAADSLKNIVFPVGSMIGIFPILACCLILLFPFCTLSGFLFTRITGLLAALKADNSPARVYAYESLGSMVGGALLNLVLVFFLKPFQVFLVSFVLVAVILTFVALRSKLIKIPLIIALSTLVVVFLTLYINPDMVSRKLLFPGQEIEYYKDTPFGSLLVTRSAEQRNFFGNSTLLFTTNDETSIEESVHYAMLQRSGITKVLLVEGGISGSLKEILKYQGVQVDYVEVNPWILRLGNTYTQELSDNRVKVHQEDIRRFLRSGTSSFDAVLLQVPEPSTLLANRYYTLEFFRLMKKRLNPGAVCSLGMMPTPNYMGEESSKLQSVMYSTLSLVFQHVVIIPGEKNYFLASDQPLDISIAALSTQKGIPAEYVNAYYLDDDNIRQRNGEIMKNITGKASINHDFKPVAYFGQLQYWLSYYGQSLGFLIAAVIILLLIVLTRVNLVQSSIMVTGFSASSIEILLLYIFQVFIGNLYLMVGIMILVFMGGLYIGSLSDSWLKLKPGFLTMSRLQIAMAILALPIMALMVFAGKFSYHPNLVYLVILMFVLLTAIIAGIQYRVSAAISTASPAAISGSLYSADLLGSAAGTLLVSIWLTPLLGIYGSLTVIAVLNLLTALWIRIRSRKLILV